MSEERDESGSSGAAHGPLLLTVGFYGLVAGVAASLFLLPLLVWLLEGGHGSESHRWTRHTAQWGWPIAVGLVVASWPRRGRNRVSGIIVTEHGQPRLFAAMRKIADGCGAAMPHQIVVTGEMNASVTVGGGHYDIASRRVLSLGLPLLQLLSKKEAAAVIAHEFGHFVRGHTKFGSWAWRTRASMIRVGNVRSISNSLGVLFRWYARMFLRSTRTLARQQELEADRLAARVVDPESLANALRRVGPGARALHAYMEHQFVPVLRCGRRPPWLAGFEQFLHHVGTNSEFWRPTTREERAVDPYDSHPPLAERLARLDAVAASAPLIRTARSLAVGWIDDLDDLERKTLDVAVRGNDLPPSRPIAWCDVGRELIVPRLEARREGLPREFLVAATLASLPDLEPQLERIGASLPTMRGAVFATEVAARGALVGAAASALADAALAALAGIGWRLEPVPGRSWVASNGTVTLAPHGVWGDRAAAAVFRRDCASAGVGDLDIFAGRATPVPAEPVTEPEARESSEGDRPERGEKVPRRTVRKRRKRPGDFVEASRWLGKWTAVIAAFVLMALGFSWLIREPPPDRGALGARVQQFCNAWNTADHTAMGTLFLAEGREEFLALLPRLMKRREWSGRFPQIGDADIGSGDGTVVWSQVAVPGGAMRLRWQWSRGNWWLERLSLRP